MLRRSYEYQDKSLRRSFNEGQAKTICAVLEARGLAISEEQRERILGATESAELERWARKAATVKTTAELFED